MAKRGRPKKTRAQTGPQPCSDCGAPGTYAVDQHGVPTPDWRCRDCHEKRCRRAVREDFWLRYGR